MNPVSAAPLSTADSQAPPDGVTPNIVGNIPVHSQGGMSGAVSEDAELDQIMQDVNHELKKTDKKAPSHHFHFERRHHKKAEAKFSAQPRPVMDLQARPPVTAASRPATPIPVQPHSQPVSHSQPATQPKPAPIPKAVKTSSVPVMAIVLTLIATGGLIAAAIYSYK